MRADSARFPVRRVVVFAHALLSLVVFSLGIHRYGIAIGHGVLAFFGAWISSTFLEYLAHRYLNHASIFRRMRARFFLRLPYEEHAMHHRPPHDVDKVILHPGLLVGGFAMLFLFFRQVIGGYAFVVYPGFACGYAVYVAIHWCIHNSEPPRLLRFLWDHHQTHHRTEADRAFGVSSPLWDFILGTMPRKRSKSLNP